MKSNDMMLLLGAGVALYFISKQTGALGPQPSFQTCKYPDGTSIQVPIGNACPIDPTHGGQSYPCYPGTFVGPLPPGTGYC